MKSAVSVHLNVSQDLLSIYTVTVSGIKKFSFFFKAFEPVALDSKELSLMILKVMFWELFMTDEGPLQQLNTPQFLLPASVSG